MHSQRGWGPAPMHGESDMMIVLQSDATGAKYTYKVTKTEAA